MLRRKNNTDDAAFERLYEQYVDLMLYTANNILNDRSEAEDAVQEAFMRIAKNFHLVEKEICPKTANQYVMITRNIAIDIYRKKHRSSAEELPEYAVGFDARDDKSLEINSVLMELPQEQRDLLYLYHIYGLTVKEIAKLLGIKTAAVYKRIERAEEKYRILWKESEL